MKSSPVPFKNIPTILDLKACYPTVKGLFFDMDGTIFNTEPIHTRALLKIGDKYKIKPPYSQEVVHQLMVGKADHLLFDIIKSWEGMPKNWDVHDFVKEKNMNVVDLIVNTPVSDYLYPEMVSLIENAYEEGFFMALVTSSEKIVTDELLRISGLAQFFHLILTRDDCPRHKPDPWPYLKAIELSKLQSNQIVIFEDSSVGIEAATSSSQHVIKVEWY
jgi:beta-phosphoglucomutase-like phosphatase (HAD superfamily)